MGVFSGMEAVDELNELMNRSAEFTALIAGAEQHPTERVRWGVAADYAEENLGAPRLAQLLRAFLGEEWAVTADGKTYFVCGIEPSRFRSEFVSFGVSVSSPRIRSRFGKFETFRMFRQVIAFIHAAKQREAAKAKRKADAKAARAAALVGFVNPYRVGELLYCAWGYDETHYDFAEVVGVGPRSVTVRRIAGRHVDSRHWGHEEVAPVKGAYLPDDRGGKATVARLTIAAGRDGAAGVSLSFGGHRWYKCADRETFHESTGR